MYKLVASWVWIQLLYDIGAGFVGGSSFLQSLQSKHWFYRNKNILDNRNVFSYSLIIAPIIKIS